MKIKTTGMDTLSLIKSKIYSLDKFLALRRVWKFQEEELVFTNGCFDILHLGHVEYLAKAAYLGKHMVVGLNTDASIKRIKGPSRPLQDEQTRQMVMASLHFVDAVVLFDDDTPYELIKAIVPDILVKGSDYKAESIIGYDIVIQNGGSVQTIDLTEGYSTTNVVNKMGK